MLVLAADVAANPQSMALFGVVVYPPYLWGFFSIGLDRLLALDPLAWLVLLLFAVGLASLASLVARRRRAPARA